ncbi:MAG: DUF1538 family protein [Eubacteriales bacterium]|nr:DUF1538 family protein [Eubacteriales bacterium]
MGKELLLKFKDAVYAILPVVLVLIVFNFAVPSLSLETDGSKFGPVMTSLLISIVPLILGTALFNIGAEKSVAKIGEIVGSRLTKRKTLTALFIVAFLLGLLCTFAEPDLSVLASRINPDGPDWILIAVASLGVGIFLLVAIIRIIKHRSLKVWLGLGYGLIFSLALLSDPDFFTLAFDAGGVTTGVVTVPFIIALGVEVSKSLGGNKAEDDSFGFSGLCSMGTVLAVILYSLALKGAGGIARIQDILAVKFNINSGTDSVMTVLKFYDDIPVLLLENFLGSLKDVSLSMLPIVSFFILFNIFAKIKGKALGSIVIGFVYIFFGLILFFLGAETGFIPLASGFGKWFASSGSDMLWLFILFGFVIGFIAMLAEPAVKVLAVNVSEVSNGVISQNLIFVSLGLATAIAITLNIIRVMFDIDFVYFIVPLFILAIVLCFFAPDIYVGIAIDAAGVATGTMASCFFLPMFIGYSAVKYQTAESFGRAIMRNGFGVVGLMSVMPIIAVEIVGIAAVLKTDIAYKKAYEAMLEPDDSQVIHLPSYQPEEKSA